MALWPGAIALTRFFGHRFTYFADAFLVGTFLAVLAEFLRPKLQLRKLRPGRKFASSSTANNSKGSRPADLQREITSNYPGRTLVRQSALGH